MNKSAYTVADQVALLKQRGMLFRDEAKAYDRVTCKTLCLGNNVS